MSDMVEWVAKAMLNEASELDGDNYTWETPYWQMHYSALARAAIKAMREPTDEMFLAGRAEAGTNNKWRTMIDEALEADK